MKITTQVNLDNANLGYNSDSHECRTCRYVFRVFTVSVLCSVLVERKYFKLCKNVGIFSICTLKASIIWSQQA